MLKSLRVNNFRAFRDLKLSQVRPVNLIVGRNNVGKTSLLEAVHLYSSYDVLDAVIQLLTRRQEYLMEQANYSIIFDKLFYQDSQTAKTIEIGEINVNSELVIRPMWMWLEKSETELGNGSQNFKRKFNAHPPSEIKLITGEVISAQEVLAIERGLEDIKFLDMIQGKPDLFSLKNSDNKKFNKSLFLPSSGFQDESIDTPSLWDRIVMTDKEDAVLDALRVIESGLQRVVMVQGKNSKRVALVRLLQHKTMPLRSLGEGMNKLFELALGLVNTGEGGTFLVDEIDSGLHFSTLVDVWHLVFEIAEKLQIQVFATTHSWDCIESFQKVTIDHPNQGLLIRLDRSDEDIKSEFFADKELSIITRESIEVR